MPDPPEGEVRQCVCMCVCVCVCVVQKAIIVPGATQPLAGLNDLDDILAQDWAGKTPRPLQLG